MARTPAVTRESVPEDQRAAFDEYVQENGSVPASGPRSVLLNVPDVSKRAIELARFLLEETSLSSRIKELAMLLTAREMDCRFIWNAHATLGRRAGLRDDIVASLRDRKELPRLAPDEAAVVNYGREFFRTHRVSQATFDAALAQFGVRGLTELTNLMGCYVLFAFNANAFNANDFGTGLPAEGTEEALPI